MKTKQFAPKTNSPWTLTGTSASTGTAKGPAVIIKTLDDLRKARKGCIIVSDKTIPEMILAMHKAAGIVTARGGITCHAAIVSRELGIPCIVGCEKILETAKDNELLTIDCARQTVRSITKKEYDSLPENKNQPIKASITNSINHSSPLIAPLETLTIEDASSYGMKSARLGELFPKFTIPKGFCLSFEAVQKRAHLHKTIKSHLKTLTFPVAIRSSATHEDSAVSFAGMFKTTLNITSEKEFFKALDQCALADSKVKAYAKKFGAKPKIALLVQEMVDAEKSGVAFSLDPTYANKNSCIIESIPGTGEDLVSGTVTPSRTVLSRSGEIKTASHLTEKEARAVFDTLLSCERHFGEAQDIEFAIKNETVHLLQSRNITTTQLTPIQRYEVFVKTAYEDYSPSESWPLNPGQVNAYFDADEALEMKYILEKSKTLSPKTLKSLLPTPTCRKLALLHNGIIGLKVADKFNVSKNSPKELEKFIQQYITTFGPLNLNSQETLTFTEKKKILGGKWSKLPAKQLSKLITSADALTYSLYGDAYIASGLERKGPYDACERFGPGAKIIIFDYFDLNPTFWKKQNETPKKLRISIAYTNTRARIDPINRIITPPHFAQSVISYKIEGSELSPQKLIAHLARRIKHQTQLVESLTPIDQVRYLSLSYHYPWRKLRTKFLGHWKPTNIENIIKRFGTELIKRFEKGSSAHELQKLFDPNEPLNE